MRGEEWGRIVVDGKEAAPTLSLAAQAPWRPPHRTPPPINPEPNHPQSSSASPSHPPRADLGLEGQLSPSDLVRRWEECCFALTPEVKVLPGASEIVEYFHKLGIPQVRDC